MYIILGIYIHAIYIYICIPNAFTLLRSSSQKAKKQQLSLLGEKKWISMRARVDQLLVLGMVIQPLIRNPYNGYINPYGIGLMSLSPIIWK